VDPDADFPRYTRTTDLACSGGLLMGPFEDKHAAGRFIQLIEDAFDLCRYYNILLQAPSGKACAYKDMGKCPAPCDGTISMVQYRQMVRWSAEVAADPLEHIRQHALRMQAAAGELNFEAAGKIKTHIDQLRHLAGGDFRHVGLLKDLVYLSLQRGPRAGTARVFLITPAAIVEIAGVISASQTWSDLLRLVFSLTEHAPGPTAGGWPAGADMADSWAAGVRPR
jgi:excinuclease UvrABC nuclease subunit